jgi:FkbM family methyltransferase
MLEHQKLKLASLLFKYMFPLYRKMYFRYKNRKDKLHLMLINKLVKPGNKILDIGANIGFFTKFLSDKTGSDGHVYSFEPDEINFQHLKNELRNSANVTLVKKAVASSSGKLKLYSSSLLNVDHRTYPSENSKSICEVDKISIDDFVNGKFKVDFIKMDIQGFESEALKGMNKTISENSDLLIFMEFWPYGLQQAGSSAEKLYDLVTSEKFLVYIITEEGLKLFTREQAMSMKVEYYTDCNVLLTRKVL